MELDHLAEFIDLAASLNFTETADRLHLAQPTLSKHISALEHELDARFFKRSSSRVELTEEGYYFLGVAHNVMGEIERARSILAEMRERKPVYLDGRFSDGMLAGLISQACAALRETGTSVVFNHETGRPPLDLLIDGTIDLLIDIQPAQDLENYGIERMPLFSRPLIAIVDAGNPLARQGRLTVPDLAECTLVRLMGGDCDSGWEKIAALCRESGFEPRSKTILVRSMAEGITMAPRDSVLLYPGAAKELKYLSGAHKVGLPVEGSRTAFATYAMYRRENRERLQAFLAELARVGAELGGTWDGA